MKLKFTEKLVFESSVENEGIRTVVLASYLNEGYIERMIKISFKRGNIEKIYFSSNEFGTANWSAENGFFGSHRWESEDDLDGSSFITRKYPALIEDGPVTQDYTLNRIVPDILDRLLDQNLSMIIYKIIRNPEEKISSSWDEIIENYAALSREFIDRNLNNKIDDGENNNLSQNAGIKTENKNSEQDSRSSEMSRSAEYLKKAERLARKIDKIK